MLPATVGRAAAPSEADVHHDIARDIGQQVEIMILDAKHQSEAKVGKEIQKVKTKMEQMSEKIKLITERVARLEPCSAGLLKSDFFKSIAKLEEVWEGEVGTLKHELWQTIQAHNHNADLLKHHKDAIDQVQGRMAEAVPNPELEQVHAQLMQVDKVMQREQVKEQQMDQLMHRLTIVQQQLSGAIGLGGPWSGLPGFPGMTQAQAAAQAQVAAAAAAAAASKKAQRKAPAEKAKALSKRQAKAASAASLQAASLRAEAPEFVPTAAGWAET